MPRIQCQVDRAFMAICEAYGLSMNHVTRMIVRAWTESSTVRTLVARVEAERIEVALALKPAPPARVELQVRPKRPDESPADYAAYLRQLTAGGEP